MVLRRNPRRNKIRRNRKGKPRTIIPYLRVVQFKPSLTMVGRFLHVYSGRRFTRQRLRFVFTYRGLRSFSKSRGRLTSIRNRWRKDKKKVTLKKKAKK